MNEKVNPSRGPEMSAGEERNATIIDVRCLDDASYVLGALTPAERREFQRHLARCSRCQLSVPRLARVPWLLALTDARSVDHSALW